MQSTGLEDVLLQSLQLQAIVFADSPHPDLKAIRVELHEIQDRTRHIATECQYDRSKAHYLLTSSGIDPSHTEVYINSISLNNINQPVQDSNNDVAAYVSLSKAKNLLAIIDQRRLEMEADFRGFLEKSLSKTWQSRKNTFLEHYRSSVAGSVRHEADAANSVSRDRFSHKITTRTLPPASGFEDVSSIALNSSSWTAKEQTFAQAIHSLNEHRLMKQPVAIASLMSQLTKSLAKDNQTHQLADSWQIVSFIVDEKHIEHGRNTVGKLVQARHYMTQYVECKNLPQINRIVADGARRYLENQFFSLIEREIARNPHQAKLGGSPTLACKIKAFVNLRLSKNNTWLMPDLEIVNNVPLWAVLFYLLRAGFLMEVVRYSIKHETIFNRIDKHWCTYISAYANESARDLPRQLADRLHTEYNQRMKFAGGGIDPFKKALYKIIGRCDLTHKTMPEVLPITEDWMWLQLTLVREASKHGAQYDRYDLVTLQEILEHYGERHFNPKGANPLLYFQILLLSGQFERSVSYLAQQSFTDAVHFAIVLTYYGLLRIPREKIPAGSRLLYDQDNSIELDFGALLHAYVGQIWMHNATAAAEYVSLICLNSDVADLGSREVRGCHAILRNLILQTREFAVLLGDIRIDGSREPGFIERRLPLLELQDERKYLRTITEQAASISEREGRISDAILLYHLSENYDVAVALSNNRLGEALLENACPINRTSLHGKSTADEDPAVLAKNMLDLYKANPTILSSININNRQNCATLLAIVESQKQFQMGNHELALSTVESTGLIPLADDLSVGAIKELSQNLSLLDDCVARNAPNLLLLTARCFKQKLERLTTGDFNNQSRQQQLHSIRRLVRNLSTFAGLIKYQINEDVRLALENVMASIR